ncbi:hypothetical protein LGN19_29770 [Burkholderia sp. AU30198]|uniref:hypothetical protein n=1 Tax=Burkholderia sp. AU30198 TaxID=2879627 RepID=UPI001CF575EC|nr:hypothetical protein [Burkholderia sp. AU30198]MCA8297987.1 hypothetical protein [Burkholderia sp. AU30198]
MKSNPDYLATGATGKKRHDARMTRGADAAAPWVAARGTFGRGEPEAKRSYQVRPATGIAGSRMSFMPLGR